MVTMITVLILFFSSIVWQPAYDLKISYVTVYKIQKKFVTMATDNQLNSLIPLLSFYRRAGS